MKRRALLFLAVGDPNLKLVMVQTAVAHNASVTKESLGTERLAVWRGLVETFGTW